MLCSIERVLPQEQYLPLVDTGFIFGHARGVEGDGVRAGGSVCLPPSSWRAVYRTGWTLEVSYEEPSI